MNKTFNRNNIRKMRIIGFISDHIDCTSKELKSITDKQINKVPFSKYHETYSEYIKDRKLAYYMALKDIEIPDSLINKIRSTMDELEINT